MIDRIHTRRAATLILITLLSLVLLALALLAAGCRASNVVQAGPDDNGRQIEMKVGQELVITLEANPTTGYSWDVDALSEDVIRAAGEPEFESASTLVGAGGTQTMRFEAVEAGQSTLTLAYRRPWEKDVRPIETYSIEVIVR
jgi:inhibitor of cysteine peptidase